MLEVHLLDLTFPGLSFGPLEIPWDLRPWLYRGGAQTPAWEVATIIKSGRLGHPLVERIELVRQIHQVLLSKVDGSSRRSTVRTLIQRMTNFVQWVDQATGPPLSLTTAEEYFRLWCDALSQRVRTGDGLQEVTAYASGARVGLVLDAVLGRNKPLIKTTHLRKTRKNFHAVSPKADKQNLEETFAFGHFLLDVADQLNEDAIWGPLPLHIPLRNGNTLELTSGLRRSEVLKPPNPKWLKQSAYAYKQIVQARANWEAEKTYRTRYPLINLRIQVEMFMLMGQPAVNLAQAFQLRMDQWRFKSSSRGYEIRTYKHRRMGPVIFEIYSDYREVFTRYLQWRKTIFPDDPHGLLFPLLGKGGGQPPRRTDQVPSFSAIKKACKRAGINYLPPSALRNTNVNWMLRRSQDPDLTAAEKQHTTETLLRFYEKPSLQRAMVQVQVFWTQYDPALAAAGPGSCTGEAPEPVPEIPNIATRPDCRTPAGCLFCTHQRDIDSFDHVWSLASYRLLKSFELSVQAPFKSNKPPPQHPAEAVINRITAKLNFIKASSPERSKWVKEALTRLEEGQYHSLWAGLIENLFSTEQESLGEP